MILFTGLRDFTIRNLIESSFAEYAVQQKLDLHGFIYQTSYDAYAPLLASSINMKCESQDIHSYAEIEKRATNLAAIEEKSRFARFGTGKSKAHVTYKRKILEKQKSSSFEKLKFEVKLIRGTLEHLTGKHQRYNKKFLDELNKLQQQLAPQYAEKLKQLNPALVVSCSPESTFDLVWIMAAKSLGIPTAAWLRSWDNVSTKINILPDFDHYILWSEWLKQDLDKYYPEYKTRNKVITGSLQFDNHLKKENIIPKDEFYNLMGLDINKPFILYAVGGAHICPHEIHIIKFIYQTLQQIEESERPQLLVRMHPYIWKTEPDFVNQLPTEVATWPSRKDAQLFAGSSNDQLLKEYKILISSLFYQAVQINIASTMTLDSAIFDKPVINVGFDATSVGYWAQVKHYYRYDHYIPVTDSGAVDVVYNENELKKSILEALHHPEKKQINRKQLVELESGPMDGAAGKRMVDFLTQFN
jgi:hypothetical protein